MSCENNIDVAGIEEIKISCLNRATFDFAMLFFLDEEEDVEDTLAGSRFDMTVKDNDGNIILAFSTETEPGGLTISGYNQLDFLKTPEQMDIPAGMYKYLLQRTVNEVVYGVTRGDFVVSENTNPLDSN